MEASSAAGTGAAAAKALSPRSQKKLNGGSEDEAQSSADAGAGEDGEDAHRASIVLQARMRGKAARNQLLVCDDDDGDVVAPAGPPKPGGGLGRLRRSSGSRRDIDVGDAGGKVKFQVSYGSLAEEIEDAEEQEAAENGEAAEVAPAKPPPMLGKPGGLRRSSGSRRDIDVEDHSGKIKFQVSYGSLAEEIEGAEEQEEAEAAAEKPPESPRPGDPAPPPSDPPAPPAA